jgi:hypothetical protein
VIGSLAGMLMSQAGKLKSSDTGALVELNDHGNFISRQVRRSSLYFPGDPLPPTADTDTLASLSAIVKSPDITQCSHLIVLLRVLLKHGPCLFVSNAIRMLISRHMPDHVRTGAVDRQTLVLFIAALKLKEPDRVAQAVTRGNMFDVVGFISLGCR